MTLYTNCYFDFTNKFSTNHTLFRIVEQISSNLDNKTVCGDCVVIEKAFYTMNHEILTYRLEHIWIWGIPNKWISSHQSNRTQIVSSNGVNSKII